VTATIAWVRDFAERLIAVRIVESSIVLAAQAFLALFPLVIVVSAVVPQGVSTGLLNELRRRFGVSGESAGALQKVLVDHGAIQQSLSVISFILVIGSATAFTRALQRVYQNAWGLPKLGLRGLWRGVAWLLGLVAYLSVLGAVAHLIKNGGALQPIATILGFGLWWWTPFLLLGGRVRARALLPAAVIITAAQLAASIASSIVVPRTIRNNESSYGPIGAVFALESWFVVVCGILVVGATLGAAIGLSDSRLGTWVRGKSDPDSWRREVTPARIRRFKTAAYDGEPAQRSGEPQPADLTAPDAGPVEPKQRDAGASDPGATDSSKSDSSKSDSSKSDSSKSDSSRSSESDSGTAG
jgi:membrane protein